MGDCTPRAGISIHAPVKGATTEAREAVLEMAISIHAPVKGATIPCPYSRHLVRNFNPRSREGSDKIDSVDYLPKIFQSTLP